MAEDPNELRKRKHLYIIENVTDDGFDTSRFNQFLAETRGAGFSTESLSFVELEQVVAEFNYMKQQEANGQYYEQQQPQQEMAFSEPTFKQNIDNPMTAS